MSRNSARLLARLLRAQKCRDPINGQATAAVGVHPHRTPGRVAVDYVDIAKRDAEHIGDHLGKRRFMALAVGRTANHDLDLPGQARADNRAAEEPDAGVRTGHGRWPKATDLDVGRQADPDVFALLASFGLLLAEAFVIDQAEHLV